MSKLDELAKQGIFYHRLGDAPAQAEQAKPAKEQGDFSRGFEKAMIQVPQTLGGAAAYAGDVMGAEGLKQYGLGVYQKNSEKIDAISKDSDSLSNVLESDASGADWLQNTAGYVTGQALQAIVTGGVGGFIGSQLAKRGIANVVARGANSVAAKQVAAKVAAKGATIGAGTALFGSNLTQEAGSIYPEALDHAAGEGRELDGGDLARVGVAATGAAAVDTAMDAIMMGRVLKGARKPGESMARAAIREVPGAMARETVTEGIQTGIERWGAQKELGTADAIREYVDSMGVGAVGGGMGGAASVIRANKAVPEVGPLSRAANIATEQEILQLENNPQRLIAFPDGTVGDEAAKQAFLSQFADPEERQRKERELMGRDPETGKRIKPEEAKSAESAEAEAQALADWGAQHDPIPLEQAHALLAAPGMKGENMMVAPHPGGEGFTLVPSEWLTLDSQARHGELQKPAKEGDKEKANAVSAPADNQPAPVADVANTQPGAAVAAAQPGTSGAAALVDAAPGAPALTEPEWKTNPYTAYKFADAERADLFMTNKGVDRNLFEALEIDGKFAIKRRAAPLSPTEPHAEGAADADDAVLPQNDGAARGPGDPVAGLPEPGEAVGIGAAAPQPGEPGTADAGAVATGEPDSVRAVGSADTDAALTFKTAKGSTYTVNPDGSTVRNKAARAEHPGEEGMQPASKRTVYVSAEDAQKLGEVQVKGARRTVVFDDTQGIAGVRYLDGKDAGKIERRTVVPFKTTPEVGLTPVEYWGDDSTVHFGNTITEVSAAAAPTESAPTPEETADVPERPQVPEETPSAPGAQAAQQVDKPAADGRDDGADIPLAFYKKTRVTADVFDEESGATVAEQVPSDQALAAVREDIKNLTALLKCMKGG